MRGVWVYHVCLLTLASCPLWCAAQVQSSTASPAHTQTAGPVYSDELRAPNAKAKARPKYQLTRWSEDWSFLVSPQGHDDPFDRIKFIVLPFARSSHLTLSGQLREEFISQSAGFLTPVGDDYGLHRLYLGADLHLGNARVFAELANTEALDKRRPLSPTDRNDLDMQLLFADYRGSIGKLDVVGRAGRQELVFDTTQRFLSLREGPNNRQAFDAVRADMWFGGIQASAFSGRPVLPQHGTFDDRRSRQVRFEGLTLTASRAKSSNSLYALRYFSDGARLGGAVGEERRSILGGRSVATRGPFDYDVEVMVQRGDFGPRHIRAWAVGSLAGYTFHAARWAPRLGVQWDIASGDRDRADTKIETFNPLFPNGAYFTPAPVSGYSNVHHAKVSLSANPTKSGNFSLSYASFSKHRTGDFVYLAPFIPQPATADMRGRQIGRYLQFSGAHRFGRHFSLTLEADRFFADAALKAVGGQDVSYIKLSANYLF